MTRAGVGEFRIVYRPHPWREKRQCDDRFDPKQFRQTILDPQLEQAYYANKRSGEESVASKTIPSLEYYPRLLNHASFLISPMSSMSLEAALFNVPTIVLANDDEVHPLPGSLQARFHHFAGGRDVQGWQFVDDLADLSSTLMRLYERTRHDEPGNRSFAPVLANSMARYLCIDERSYADRLLEATDVILNRVSGRRALAAVGA